MAPCRAAAIPAGAPPVPPPTTTTSYSPRTGRPRASEVTAPSPPLRHRIPPRSSRIAPGPAFTAPPGIFTPRGVDITLACEAAIAPMRVPIFISSSGRRSFSAAWRGMSAQPPSTNRLSTPSGWNGSGSTLFAPGQSPARLALPLTGSGGTWNKTSEESSTAGSHVLSRAICSALAKDAKESSLIGISSVYSTARRGGPSPAAIKVGIFFAGRPLSVQT